jgi:hypothetical protein
MCCVRVTQHQLPGLLIASGSGGRAMPFDPHWIGIFAAFSISVVIAIIAFIR